MGDPEAESPKATHHAHVHVELHDDARTQPTHAQVIQEGASPASNPRLLKSKGLTPVAALIDKIVGYNWLANLTGV